MQPLVRTFVALLCLAVTSVIAEPLLREQGWPQQPDPVLHPQQVVRIQLEALRENDLPEQDAGIAVAYRFASPENRSVTGSVEQFSRMIHQNYDDLLDHDSAVYDPVIIFDDEALQRVTVQVGEMRYIYRFYLRRQARGQFAECWMTDSVVREAPENAPPQDENPRTEYYLI